MPGTPTAQGLPAVARGLVTEHLGLKLLSLVVAAGLWAWVQSGEVVEARTRAQIRYVWPEGLLPDREVPTTLVVTLSGPQGVARSIDKDALAVTVDLSERGAGSTSIDFSALEIDGLPSTVSVVQISPPAIDLELDRALRRKLDVSPTVLGDPASGWAVRRIEVEPSTVTVVGPNGRMRTLAEIATDVVDIAGAREDKTVEVGLALGQAGVGLAPGAPEKVRVRIDVEPVLAERSFDEVPVRVRGTGWVAEPSTVRIVVKGPQATVGALSPEDLSLLLHPPEDDPDGRAELVWKAGEAGGVEILGTGGAEVEVGRVEPRRFKLELRR